MAQQGGVPVVEGAKPEVDSLRALAASLHPGESPVLGALTYRYEIFLSKGVMANLLISDRRLLLAKSRAFGRFKVDKEVDLARVTHIGFGPLLGVGPTWEVAFRAEGGRTGSMYFAGPLESEPVARALQSVAERLR